MVTKRQIEETFSKAYDELEYINANGWSNQSVVIKSKEGQVIPLSRVRQDAKHVVDELVTVSKNYSSEEELQEAVYKATLALSDLTSGGLLAVQQEENFIDLLQQKSVLLNRVRYESMRNPTQEFSKRSFGGGNLRLASQDPAATSPYDGRNFTESLKVKPALSKVQLSVVEVQAVLEFPYEVIEDNIERGRFQEFTMRAFRNAIGIDMENIIINGDTTSGDNVLKIRDGVLKLTTTNVHNAGAAALTSGQIKDVLKQLPNRYNSDRRNYLLFASDNAAIDYQFELLSKASPYGDRILTQDIVASGGFMGAGGVTVMPTNLMPNTQALFLNPENVILGFHRDLQFEMDKDIERRLFKVVATARFDMKLLEEEAVVKVINLAA